MIFSKLNSVFRFTKNLTGFLRNRDVRYQPSKSFVDTGEASTPCGKTRTGVVIGVYTDKGQASIKLTPTAENIEARLSGSLQHRLKLTLPFPKVGEARAFHGLHPIFSSIVVVGLGDECTCYCEREQMDERKEFIRVAAAAGVRELLHLEMDTIEVESFGHAESAAEGASLGAWLYQEFKRLPGQIKIPKLKLLDDCDCTGWQIGLHKAAAQNLARHLQEKPGNNLTPQLFAQSAVELLSKHHINVEVRMQHWAKLRNLNAFLAAGQGGCDPVFLELFYEGCDPDICPIVLIGKGVTFNAGGLCKPKTCQDLKHQRGDMAGAAVVLATIRAVAALRLPINVRGLIPLCSNVPGARGFKPGDLYRAHNGKTILVENTDCEGLLMHADALSYSKEYNPKFILDIGTMTYGTHALGQAAHAVFTDNESLYEMMRIASIHTGDRIWRFPLWKYFSDHITRNPLGDFTNKVPQTVGGGPCKAAAFLKEFVPPGVDWIHLDIQNIFRTGGKDFSYLKRGMTGRPTRNLIEFLAQLSCNSAG